MRTRTQIAQWWEVRYEGAELARFDSREAAMQYRRRYGCADRVVRVTRYRLAPMVDLPPWRRSDMGLATANDAAWGRVQTYTYAACVYAGAVTIRGNANSLDESRRACEEALRMLGYRVAKRKQ